MLPKTHQTLVDFLLDGKMASWPHPSCQQGTDWSLVRGLSLPVRAMLVAREFVERGQSILVVTDSRFMQDWLENLQGILGEQEAMPFSPWGLKPYVNEPPFESVLEDRLAFAQRLRQKRPVVGVTTQDALLDRLPPLEAQNRPTLHLQIGQTLDLQALRETCRLMGFHDQPLVENIGDFSIRGCIFDVNPLLSEHPIRVELFGDEIESIRTFDLFSQKSLQNLKQVDILPMGELIPGEDDLNGELFRRARHETLSHNLLHWMQPALLVYDEYELFSNRAENLTLQWDKAWQTTDLPMANAPADLRYTWETLQQQCQQLFQCGFSSVQMDDSSYQWQWQCLPQERFRNGLDEAIEKITEFRATGGKVYLAASSQGHASRLSHLLQSKDVDEIVVGWLQAGFWLPELGEAYLTDHQIFNRNARRIRKQGVASSAQAMIDVESLALGDYVVHRDHGVGKFLGLSRLEVNGVHVDVVTLEYAGKDHLRFPVDDLFKIEKLHTDSESHPALQKLGGHTWERTTQRVRRRIVEIARELVALYARRQVIEGFPFPPDGPAQIEFEETFAWEPTPDQVKASSEIKTDMESSRPMDRLVCGDVGFGKTEVALRACFKAVHARKQVAVLVPTTILAAQHYETFCDRFAAWPVTIELVNRYRSPAEKKKIFQNLEAGNIDIVVGTHALLADKVVFKDLGLLVVDEEQRFGVKQKEKLRHLRMSVDTLSMSATPIPRTLHLSLTGVRDISTVNTPPRNRLPVDTKVVLPGHHLLRDAIREELDRGGQIFVVNDRIQGLDDLSFQVEEWAPQARIATAHGQMNEKDLETVMAAFVRGDVDILVSTSIVENGIDVPNANTMLIFNAHRFGMSQLYQMRGRVGRSHVHAKALLVVGKGPLVDEARQRLEALERCTDLGSGYQLAMKDLEIRGAGNLLGDEQHGFIAEVGFETYVRMVREAVEELQGKAPEIVLQPRVELGVDAYLPESWIEDGLLRMSFYQRLARIDNPQTIASIEKEMRDRFGPLPEPAQMILLVSEVGLWARLLGIQGLQLKEGILVLTFTTSPVPDPRVLAEIQSRVTVPFRFVMSEPLQAVLEFGRQGQQQESGARLTLEALRHMGQGIQEQKRKELAS